ncbi:MAG: FAD-dependent oxidoreductase, partial [Candidatus Dormibacterales bacterium]
MRARVVIAGGGVAAAGAVMGLRAAGHEGPVTVLAGEPEPPYERPPLSKGYLAGAVPRSRLTIRGRPEYEAMGVDLRLGVRVSEIDLARRRVALEPPGELGFEALLIATGASARRLPGLE